MEIKDEIRKYKVVFSRVDNRSGEKKNKAKKIVDLFTKFKWETHLSNATDIEREKKGFKYVGNGSFEEYTDYEYSINTGLISCNKEMIIKQEYETINSILKKKNELIRTNEIIKYINSDVKPTSLIAKFFWALVFGIPAVLLFIFNDGLLWLKIILSVLAGFCLLSIILTPYLRKKDKILKNSLPEKINRKEELEKEINELISCYSIGDYEEVNFEAYLKILEFFNDNPTSIEKFIDFNDFSL